MMTDITDLSDAALDIFLRVKAGEDVCVEHLSPAERLAVCSALGTRAPVYWLHGTCTGADVPRGPQFATTNVEGLILDRQDAFFDE